MAKNNRCPLQIECEKKCTWQYHELDCPYYSVNARPDYYIEDQEKIRQKQEREALEEWETRMTEDIEEEDKPEEWKTSTKAEITYLDGPEGVTEKIKKAMYDAARQFVYIGFLLWEVQEYGYYKEHGYQSVYEYAEAELGFKKSSTKNFIAINYEFGYRKINNGWERADHRTMNIQPKYQDFNYSQLCEMLAMSPAKRETITPDMTIKQIREIKKQPEPDLPPDMETIPIAMPEDKPTGQTSGQITTLKLNQKEKDYIKYMLEEELSIIPENDIDYKLVKGILEQM